MELGLRTRTSAIDAAGESGHPGRSRPRPGKGPDGPLNDARIRSPTVDGAGGVVQRGVDDVHPRRHR